MTASATQALVTSTVTDYGSAAFVILTAVIGIALGYLVFKFGWRKTRGALSK